MTGVVVSIRIFSLFIVFVRLTLSAVVESVAFACAQRRGCTAPMCVCLSWREKENDKLMRGVYMPIGHSGFHLHWCVRFESGRCCRVSRTSAVRCRCAAHLRGACLTCKSRAMLAAMRRRKEYI